MSHTPPDLPGSAAAIGLTIDTVLRRTAKILLARDSFRGEPAAPKYLIDPDPFWAAKWRHELDVYEVFGDTTAPVRVPRLLHSDRDRLLVLEWVDASPVAVERYPERELDTREVDAILDCIAALNEWTYPAARFSPTFDYSERVARYQAEGYLSEGQREALDSLLARCDAPAQLNHGDIPQAADLRLLCLGRLLAGRTSTLLCSCAWALQAWLGPAELKHNEGSSAASRNDLVRHRALPGRR
ncbi:hypothetical protein [Micromonospora sp. WMMD736]|uniref:hypothetical protein n=1 Tax=Micromonospora sp. WMMD736 TaxID=3404112 RepID=UPI003B945E47